MAACLEKTISNPIAYILFSLFRQVLKVTSHYSHSQCFILIFQANVGINNPREDSVVQDKEEATSENNAARNRPSSQMTRGLRNNGQIEKRSDSQVGTWIIIKSP